MARWYIGGLLKHAPSLLAFTNPTVNSYHRLVPGYEAPVNLVYSQRNRSACIRIPITGTNPKAKRIEFRVPDPSSNPYLAFAAMLMAGLDGIKNKIEPPAPVDKDLYELPPDEAAGIPQVPARLTEVLDALEADHDFLLEGGVFTPDLIETWIDFKRTHEVDPSGCVRTRTSSSCTTTSDRRVPDAVVPLVVGASRLAEDTPRPSWSGGVPVCGRHSGLLRRLCLPSSDGHRPRREGQARRTAGELEPTRAGGAGQHHAGHGCPVGVGGLAPTRDVGTTGQLKCASFLDTPAHRAVGVRSTARCYATCGHPETPGRTVGRATAATPKDGSTRREP